MEITMLNQADPVRAGATPIADDTLAVRLDAVSRRYGHGQSEVAAVGEVSLEIGEGEFLAIMGPSGSGKSTLTRRARAARAAASFTR